MALGMTIDELMQRVDPLSYWSFLSMCQARVGLGTCSEKSIGFISIANGLCRIDVCDRHAKELAFARMSKERVFDAVPGSILDLAQQMDARSFFVYGGMCEVIRANAQHCGKEAVGFFTTLDGHQVRACHLCACRILHMLTNEQPEIWLNPDARNQSVIIKMLEKWSSYERIIQFAPSLC